MLSGWRSASDLAAASTRVANSLVRAPLGIAGAVVVLVVLDACGLPGAFTAARWGVKLALATYLLSGIVITVNLSRVLRGPRTRIAIGSLLLDLWTVIALPKTLSDLYRIEAQVRATCRSCRASEAWDLGALIDEVRRNGGNTDWRSARRAVKCPRRYSAPTIDLLAIPYGRQRARRAHRHALINLALEILREAAARSGTEAVGTIEVRLALYVLRPFLQQQCLLNAYCWAATIQPRHPWTSCQLPYRHKVERLVERGAPVDEANLP